MLAAQMFRCHQDFLKPVVSYKIELLTNRQKKKEKHKTIHTSHFTVEHDDFVFYCRTINTAAGFRGPSLTHNIPNTTTSQTKTTSDPAQ